MASAEAREHKNDGRVTCTSLSEISHVSPAALHAAAAMRWGRHYDKEQSCHGRDAETAPRATESILAYIQDKCPLR